MPNWVSDKRLYLSQAGEVVDEAAPGRKTLLCGVGTTVTEADCKKYGIGPFAPETQQPETQQPDAQQPETKGHRHRYRKDSSCACGEARPDPEDPEDPAPDAAPEPDLEDPVDPEDPDAVPEPEPELVGAD